MPNTVHAHNPSILAIPVYLLLSFILHLYAIYIATNGKPLNWDNGNPRSTTLYSNLQELPDTFAAYEHAEACHANGMENLPLFVSAGILGNMGSRQGDEGFWEALHRPCRVLTSQMVRLYRDYRGSGV
ncbi:hypothetical protein K432DRAFT_380267 [Lepidopterella palustris CBS 459.81]|uniref:Uncharacterized protein n=1 Tax=Lepidopterella palustris CBS 459.81 TaxID=1314670 RepID=A0A8E2JHB4_9PEZI|nr:hypothetical protein K432DRAFT_380267 [Lepidopterella palustris CBS 459.81]